MLEIDEPGAAAVIAHFLVRFQEDRARGEVQAREHYLAAYPGHEHLIANELDALGTAARTEPSAPGEFRFGAYKVLRELGRGGQAEVYLAEDTRLGRRVALKVLRGLGSLSVERLARFQREAQIASRIEHPHLCTLYESGAEEGVPYLAMRYIEGESLAARIAEARESRSRAATPSSTRTRAEIHSAVELFEKIARAVHAAHEAGILHRDLKPQNVIIAKDGEPVVLDFGLAADLSGAGAELTRSGDIFGTPHYMSPEQVRGTRTLTRATDVWALGVSLFETLALRRPFDAPTPEGLMQEILRREAPSLRRSTSAVPRDLAVVVATALAKEPALRYQTALDLAEDLGRVRRGEPIRARPASAFLRMRRWVRREPMRAAVLLLGFCSMGLAGFLAARWSDLEAGAEQVRLAELETEIERGFQELSESESRPARASFLRALELDKSSTEALAGLGFTYVLSQEIPDGIRELEDRVAEVPDPTAIALVRASLLRKIGRTAEAEALEHDAGEPRSHAAAFVAAKLAIGPSCAHHRDKPESVARALELMQRCVWMAPKARALYHYELAHVLTHADPPSAIQLSECLTEHWAERSLSWYWLAMSLPDSARERRCAAYTRAIELNSRFAAAWTNLGNIYFDQKRLDDAEHAYTQVLSIRTKKGNNRYRALDGIARICMAREQRRVDAFERVVAGAMNDAAAAQELGLEPGTWAEWKSDYVKRKGKGGYDEAIRLGKEALEERPDDPSLITQIGRYHDAGGNDDEAESHYRAALAVDASFVPAHYRLGTVLYRTGAIQQAAACFRRALELEPELDGFEITGAQCLVAVGDDERASAMYRAIVRRQPENAEAHCNLGHCLRRRGDFAGALEALRRGHELGSKKSNWNYPSEKWVAAAERLAELEQRLLADEVGTLASATDEERAMLAEIALGRSRPADAARWFEDAFARKPRLKNRMDLNWRFLASRAAALAAESTGAADCEHWRVRSVEWLEEDLAALYTSYEDKGINAYNLRQRLFIRKNDPTFAAIRDAGRVAALPAPLRERCASHWASVDELISRLRKRIDG